MVVGVVIVLVRGNPIVTIGWRCKVSVVGLSLAMASVAAVAVGRCKSKRVNRAQTVVSRLLLVAIR